MVGNNEFNKERYTVTFKPDGKSIDIYEGTSILTAAINAGVPINAICGGEGKCGKCKVIVKGKSKYIRFNKTELLSNDEVAKGYFLACQTFIHGNLTVEVLEGTQIIGSQLQILEKTDSVKLDELNPWISSVELDLPQPSLDDNLSDWQRVLFGLKSAGVKRPVTTSMGLLRKLPKKLRSSNWKIRCTLINLGDILDVIMIEPIDNVIKTYGLAIDIGTTTIVIELIDLQNGRVIDTASDYNRQVFCGEDILSRIMYCEEKKDGLAKLNKLVIETLNDLIDELITSNKIKREEILQMVFAGNTTMNHLMYRLTPRYIRKEPYIPVDAHIHPMKAKSLGILCSQEAYIYSIPGRASYVGSDITADIIATGLHKVEGLSMLIDVGTNGEVVLGNRDFLVGCSCSAGPAFEGGEVTHGIRATQGAIETVDLTSEFNVKYSTIGNAKPKGICGSGLIDLLEGMLSRGIIDKSGQIHDIETHRIRYNEHDKEFVVVWSQDTIMGKDITISEVDIQNILRTKAALYASCRVLLKILGYTFDEIDRIYIAGGFGNYINARKAIALGLFPDIDIDKFKFIGNGAVAGARHILLSKEKLLEAESIVQNMTYIDLSTNLSFFDEFTAALFLPHTNINLFPSVTSLSLPLGCSS